MNLIDRIEAGELKKEAPQIRIGDTVRAQSVLLKVKKSAFRYLRDLSFVYAGVGFERP